MVGVKVFTAPILHLLLLIDSGPSIAASVGCSQCAQLDTFDEALHLQLVPFTNPRKFLARFEFSIKAPFSSAFRADQFDMFPKPIGKLLNAHPALSAFEATLTQGRWQDEWGPPPKEFRPPGALLIAATANASDAATARAWKFLIWTLSGTLCASFEGMDPEHPTSPWVQPFTVPWTEEGQELLFSTLPYEPVCTENLTPWLKLLPCGRHRGLTSLLAPIAIAESPLTSLSLSMATHPSSSSVELIASLNVVLPMQPELKGLEAWFRNLNFKPCPAAESSKVLLRSHESMDLKVLLQSGIDGLEANENSTLAVFSTERFASLPNSVLLPSGADAQPAPWAVVHRGDEPARKEELTVMRDILSQRGRSERTHGRYLLRLSNRGVQRSVRFMDQLPFFIRPLWHTIRATITTPGKPDKELSGVAAIKYLNLQFTPSDGRHLPTELHLTVDVPTGSVVNVFLNVLKNFIQLREFSFSCEKGFDVSSASWVELDKPNSKAGANASIVHGFLDSITAGKPFGAPPAQDAWRLRFTQGLIVLVPMPDFSMPFNVIALSSTAVTFFFGSIFRLTAAGRKPHWVLKKEETGRGLKFWLQRLALAGLLCGLYALHTATPTQVKEFRLMLPPAASPVADMIDSTKEFLDKLNR